jgi:hypothetical protein
VLLQRLAQRFCRLHPQEARLSAWAVIQRIRPDNIALTKGRKQFWMQFRCVAGQAVLCRTLVHPRGAPVGQGCTDDSPQGSLETFNHD